VIIDQDDDMMERVIRQCVMSRVWFVRNVLGVNKIEDWQLEVLTALDEGATRISIRSGHGVGKLQGKSTPIFTPDGWRKFGDLKAGDYVYGRDGTPTKVWMIHPNGVKALYKVVFDDGSSTNAGLEHNWAVRGRKHRRRNLPDWEVMTTAQIIDAGVKRPNGKAFARQWEIPRQEPYQLPEKDFALDPYILGVWLGDGTSASNVITNPEPEIWAQLGAYTQIDVSGGRCPQIRVDGLSAKLRRLGVLNNKSSGIPEAYFHGSVDQRLSLLRGLMDTDGWVDGAAQTSAVFGSVYPKLARDFAVLARGLGYKAVEREVKKSGYKNDEGAFVECKDFYQVSLCHDSPDMVPFLASAHKKAACRPVKESRYMSRWIERIEYMGEEDSMCITVEAEDALYQVDTSFVVTHNTAMCAWLALHFVLFRNNVKIPVTAPSSAQMKDGLIPETKLWAQRLPDFLKEQLDWTEDRIFRVDDRDNNFISFRTAGRTRPKPWPAYTPITSWRLWTRRLVCLNPSTRRRRGP